MICIFIEITCQLHRLVDGQTNKELIKEAKSFAISAYFNRSGTITVSIHVQKIKRVHKTLCEFLRRADQVLSSLLQMKAITFPEYESIRSGKTVYQRACDLLDMVPWYVHAYLQNGQSWTMERMGGGV